MTTITNNKLPEWRTALDKCVENYQSTRAWYEENRDSPAALDDMERAEDQLANFVRKCGFSILLGLLDEIDELQDRRRADNDEPFGFVTKRCAEHMHDDDRDENKWMWSISAVVIGCDPKLKHEVPVYLHPASSGKEGA